MRKIFQATLIFIIVALLPVIAVEAADSVYSVSGVFYGDGNRNGNRENGESGISGIQLQLVDIDGKILTIENSTDPLTATTDQTGRYRFEIPFTRFAVGEYPFYKVRIVNLPVTEMLTNRFVPTTAERIGNDFEEVQIEGNTYLQTFGYFSLDTVNTATIKNGALKRQEYHIQGILFEDNDGDGAYSNHHDFFMENRKVWLVDDANTPLLGVDDTPYIVKTDKQGNFSFDFTWEAQDQKNWTVVFKSFKGENIAKFNKLNRPYIGNNFTKPDRNSVEARSESVSLSLEQQTATVDGAVTVYSVQGFFYHDLSGDGKMGTYEAVPGVARHEEGIVEADIELFELADDPVNTGFKKTSKIGIDSTRPEYPTIKIGGKVLPPINPIIEQAGKYVISERNAPLLVPHQEYQACVRFRSTDEQTMPFESTETIIGNDTVEKIKTKTYDGKTIEYLCAKPFMFTPENPQHIFNFGMKEYIDRVSPTQSVRVLGTEWRGIASTDVNPQVRILISRRESVGDGAFSGYAPIRIVTIPLRTPTTANPIARITGLRPYEFYGEGMMRSFDYLFEEVDQNGNPIGLPNYTSTGPEFHIRPDGVTQVDFVHQFIANNPDFDIYTEVVYNVPQDAGAKRPTVTLSLLTNGTPASTSPLTLSDGAPIAKWGKQPKATTYSVQIDKTPNGYLPPSIQKIDDNHFKITFTYDGLTPTEQPKLNSIDVTITNYWIHKIGGKTGKPVTVQLMRDGELFLTPLTLTDPGGTTGAKGEWSGLNIFAPDGSPYQYNVEQTSTVDGTLRHGAIRENNDPYRFVLINAYDGMSDETGKNPVMMHFSKTWVNMPDGNGSDAEIEFLWDGMPMGWIKTLTDDGSHQAASSFNGLTRYEPDGTRSDKFYDLYEKPMNDPKFHLSYETEPHEFINTYIDDSLQIRIIGKLVWDGGEAFHAPVNLALKRGIRAEDGTAPNIEAMENIAGSEKEVSANTVWETQWMMPRTDETGKIYAYQVVEVNPPANFNVSLENVRTVRNTYIQPTDPDMTSITVIKNWTGLLPEGHGAPAEVTLYQNDEPIATQTLEDDGFGSTSWTIPNLPKIDDSGAVYRYRVDETPIDNFQKEIRENTCGFVIRNHSLSECPATPSESNTRDITGILNWVGGKPSRPTVWFKLYRKIEDSVEAEALPEIKQLSDSIVSTVWKDMPIQNDEGQTYIYSIEQVDKNGNQLSLDDYITIENGLTVTNVARLFIGDIALELPVTGF